MKIVIIAQYVQFEFESGNDRFLYIIDKLAQRGNYSIELVTSSFSHIKKRQRNSEEVAKKTKRKPYAVTLIQEPTYKTNVSLRRLAGTKVFARNVRRYLQTTELPTIIYCAVPSIDLAHAVVMFAKKHNIYSVIDIQDLWPEAFTVLGAPRLVSGIFKSMTLKANAIYQTADDVVAVSETYLERATAQRATNQGEVVYLGTDLQRFDSYATKAKLSRQKHECVVAYVGTLGKNYDLKNVIDAVKLTKSDVFRLLVMGDGPDYQNLVSYAAASGIRATFTGRMPYEKMVSYLSQSDVAVNPIVDGSACSVVNKVGDYAAAGLPVINTHQNAEYKALLEQYECGITCANNEPQKMADALSKIAASKQYAQKMAKNSRKLAEDVFDRSVTYDRIVDIITKGCEQQTKSTLSVLVSTLGRAKGLVRKMNIQGDAIVVNQSASYDVTVQKTKNGVVTIMSMPETGIGLSRNTALMHASTDIVLFADDDVVYKPKYEAIIGNEFRRHPEADGLIFNVKELNQDRPSFVSHEYKRIHLYNCLRYGGYRLAVRRDRVVKKNIYFSLLFGGGAKYSSGEDSLFIADCLKKGLKLYASPSVIGSVSHAQSTWFTGYTDKFFFDRGVFFKFFSPRLSSVMILQFALRRRSLYSHQKTFFQAIRLMHKGARSVS